MSLTIDDMRRLDQAAGQKVKSIYDQTHDRMMQPDLERRDLAEYRALSDQEHGTLMQSVGADEYERYVGAMENLAKKYGG